MFKTSKIKLITLVSILSLLIGGVALPWNFTFAQSYMVDFEGYYLVSWGTPTEGIPTRLNYIERSINLSHYGRYEVRAYYSANSGQGQLYEEFKVLVDGRYIGQTSDPNITLTGPDYENEYLGEHDITAGSHQVRLEHAWNSADVGAQSVHLKNVTFTLTVSNHSPIANAGPDKEVYEEEEVVLSGSGTDPDGDPLTYYWSCSGGHLSNRYIAQPNFTAPQVSYDRTYTCTLTVTDTYGASDSDSMNVLVKNYPPLTVDIKANNSDGPVTLYYKDYVTLSWTSQNAASCLASGDWSGSKSTSGSQTIQLNSVKTYTFTLTCTDTNGGQSSDDSVQVIVKPKPPTVITKPAVVTF